MAKALSSCLFTAVAYTRCPCLDTLTVEIRMIGSLAAIWIKQVRRQPMKAVSRATLVSQRGILGNANQNGRRHVTIISQEAWQQAERRLGVAADPMLRRAHLMVSGIELQQSRGLLLRIGNALVEIWGETRPCRTMDEQLDGLQAALRPDWAGGVFGIVLEGGDLQIGDAVELLPAPATTPFQNWKAKRLLNAPTGQAQLVFDYETDVVAKSDADGAGPVGRPAS